MNRFLIYVCDSWGPDFNLKEPLLFSTDEYAEFIRLIKEAGEYTDFSNSISLKCEICDFFIIAAESLYRTIAKIENRLRPDFEVLSSIIYRILVPVPFTTEHWEKYQRGTMKLKPVEPYIDPVYEDCIGFRFVSEECAFVFDRECSCSSIIKGKAFDC